MTGASAPRGGQQQIGEFMGRRLVQLPNVILRHLAVPSFAILLGIGSAIAQSGDLRAQDGKPAAAPADASKDTAAQNQRRTDEFAEAAQAINGPAGNPECVWIGRRVVVLVWRDDLDTAFRHLDLYDRFGCPGGHIQATFRCLTRFATQIDNKVPDSLTSRVHACWINPAAQPQTTAAQAPAPGAAAPAPAAPAAAAAPAQPPSK